MRVATMGSLLFRIRLGRLLRVRELEAVEVLLSQGRVVVEALQLALAAVARSQALVVGWRPLAVCTEAPRVQAQ